MAEYSEPLLKSAEKRSKARATYIMTNTLNMQDIADMYDIKLPTLYSWRKREQWDVMKEATNEEMKLKVISSQLDLVYDSLDFWKMVKQHCKERFKEDKKGKMVTRYTRDGGMYEIPYELDPKDAKSVAETFERAEERVLILTGIKFDQEENE